MNTYTRISLWRGDELVQMLELDLDTRKRPRQASRSLRVWIGRMRQIDPDFDSHTMRVQVGSEWSDRCLKCGADEQTGCYCGLEK
jgi:hypothetical protein